MCSTFSKDHKCNKNHKFLMVLNSNYLGKLYIFLAKTNRGEEISDIFVLFMYNFGTESRSYTSLSVVEPVKSILYSFQ